MSPAAATQRTRSKMLDFSRGLKSGISEMGSGPAHFIDAENVEFRPYRAARVRLGSQKMTAGLSAFPAHSLLEWVSASETSQKYEGYDNTLAIANWGLDRVSAAARIPQTLPFTLGTSRLLSFDQLQGALWACENGGANPLMAYRASNTAETWLSGNLPTPGNTLTLTGNATAGGLVAASYYAYRLRWVHENGSSLASTPQTQTPGGANTSINVTTIPQGARTDYQYWILERTIGAATAAAALLQPFYFLAQAPAGTLTYLDSIADTGLGYQSTELIHGQLPLADGSHSHLDGIIALNDRLAGWYGSTLYVSQPIGGDEATGPANWDARNAYDFGKDDGDRITTCVKQQDRILVFKENSVWALEGTDPLNFRVVHLYQGAGAAGLRCAACMGSAGWFYGAAGLHAINGSSIKPFGYIEVGDLISTISSNRAAFCVLRAHLGQRLLIGYSDNATYNNKILVYDLRFGTWSLWTGIGADDILCQKIRDFGTSESFLAASRLAYDSFGAIANNTAISGAGIPAVTKVTPAVVAGALSLTMDKNATATGWANLTIGATVYANCYTVNGSPTVRIGKYATRIGFYGTLDDRASDGTGGLPIPVTLRTPWVDDGSPDVFKVWDRLEVYAQGSGLNFTVVIVTDPFSQPASLSLNLPATGALWGGFAWGDGTLWAASSQDSSVARGIEPGCTGRRYRLRIHADVIADAVFKGYVLDGILQPERRYS